MALFCTYSFNKLWQKHIITPPFLTDIQLTVNCSAKNVAQVNNFYRDVIATISQFHKAKQHSYLELVLPENIKDALPFVWDGYNVGVRYSYFIDLNLSEDELLQNMSTQRRKNVRDAAKLDLRVERITDPGVILEKAVDTLSSKKAKFNQDIVRNFTNLAQSEALVCTGVYEDENLMALSACLSTPSEATYLFGWNDSTKGKSSFGTYALWNCILACKTNSQRFNFAGSQIPSVEKYFRGFGGTLTPMISVVSDKRKLTKQFT